MIKNLVSIIAASRRRQFDPLSLSPALWLSDTGSDPSVWPDISGNGWNAVQATALAQPSIVASALNGRQVRRFNGSSQLLSIPNRSFLRNLPGVTLFAVANPLVETAGERTIFSRFTSETNNLFLVAQNASQLIYGGRRVSGTAGDFNTFGTFASNTAKIITAQLRWSLAQKEAWINGSENNLDLSFQDAGNSENIDSSTDPTIGGGPPGTGRFWNGDIAEILIFPTALSNANRQAVENYLNAKWAIY